MWLQFSPNENILLRLMVKYYLHHSKIEFISYAVILSAVALTQIPAKNLALCKIMEAMHILYAKKWDSVSTYLKENMMQMIMEHMQVCEREAHIICKNMLFRWIIWRTQWYKGALKMRHSLLYLFSSLVLERQAVCY